MLLLDLAMKLSFLLTLKCGWGIYCYTEGHATAMQLDEVVAVNIPFYEMLL